MAQNLQGTCEEALEQLHRHAYNSIKLGSKWIRKDGWAKGRESRVSCKRGGKIYLLWSAYGSQMPYTMSKKFGPQHVLKYYKPAEAAIAKAEGR